MTGNKKTYHNVIDVFDALPFEIQKNHKLLKAFCYWYLDRREPKQEDRMKIKRIAWEQYPRHPEYKSSQLAELPEIDEIRKSGNYTKQTINKWILIPLEYTFRLNSFFPLHKQTPCLKNISSDQRLYIFALSSIVLFLTIQNEGVR